ncbi:MAG: hypothetical protein GY854_25150 [Deltaproteobacteria bacterium]|nr:hypothetical protein [Deltaproteobacteria bacterium]
MRTPIIRKTIPIFPSDGPLPDEVRAFWKYMQKHYGTRVVSKASSKQMKAIAWALNLLGITDKKRFMERYVTTIGRTIYVPFGLGGANEHWNLWSQIVVCVHEHQHVEQLKRDGWRFKWRYLTSKAKRAIYEAEAYRSNFELYYWRYGKLPSARKRAESLRHYGCSKLEIDVTEKYLALSAETIKRGGIANGASKVAVKWLNRYLPRLRFRKVG